MWSIGNVSYRVAIYMMIDARIYEIVRKKGNKTIIIAGLHLLCTHILDVKHQDQIYESVLTIPGITDVVNIQECPAYDL